MTHQDKVRLEDYGTETKVFKATGLDIVALKSKRTQIFVEWLRKYTDGDTELFKELVFHELLKKWFDNIWFKMDEEIVLTSIQGNTPENAAVIYEALHQPEFIHQIPPYEMIREAVVRSIEKRNRQSLYA